MSATWVPITAEQRNRFESDGALRLPSDLTTDELTLVRSASLATLGDQPQEHAANAAELVFLLDRSTTFRYVWSLLGWNIHLFGIRIGASAAAKCGSPRRRTCGIRTTVAVQFQLTGARAGDADIFEPAPAAEAGHLAEAWHAGDMAVTLEYGYRWVQSRDTGVITRLVSRNPIQQQLLGVADPATARGHRPQLTPLFWALREHGVAGLEVPWVTIAVPAPAPGVTV